MRIAYLADAVPLAEETVVCLGFFDGVHVGHASLARRAVSAAREEGRTACVHTFDRMPQRVLHPESDIRELTPLPRKAELLGGMGIEVIAVSDFEATRAMLPEDFFRRVLLDVLCARRIVCGFHHRFGAGGAGDVALLSRLCGGAGIGLDVVEPVTLADGELVSSTAIREAISAGDMGRARRMLGREAL